MTQVSIHPSFPYGSRNRDDALPGEPALSVSHLTASYQDRDRNAIDHISFHADVGTRLALVGANGSGKSTLLKCIAGLLRPNHGHIKIFGLPPGQSHHRVAYLSQRGLLDWRFPISVRQLVLTGRYVHLGWFKRPGRADYDIVDAALKKLAIESLADRQISELSGGQQQRALLARTVTQQADIFLLDEPLNAVDADTRHIVSGVLKELQQAGKTILVATHDLERVESDFDAAIYLFEGRKIDPPPGAFTGDPHFLHHHHHNTHTHEPGQCNH